jgi:hypothetical protein
MGDNPQEYKTIIEASETIKIKTALEIAVKIFNSDNSDKRTF